MGLGINGTGHIKDREDARDWATPEFVGAVEQHSTRYGTPDWGPAQPSSDLSNYIDEILDQQSSSACVGFALTRAAHIRGQIQGFSDMKRPSPLVPYTLARDLEKTIGMPLLDTGCMPRDACKGIKDFGFTPWDVWPFDLRYLNTAPSPSVLFDSADYASDGYYVIPEVGAERATIIREALSAGIPVTISLMVDQVFDSYAGSTYVMPEISGPFRGSHYVCIIGHRQDGSFLIVNSWGTDWGFGGLGLISEARLCSLSSNDPRACLIAPRIR